MQSVLVVDDEAHVCGLVQSALERNPAYRVTVALDGREAISLIDASRPDLLILDAVLPGLSGIELAELASARSIPVIIATGHDDMARALEDRGWPLLRKPFRIATLMHEVEDALGKSEINRQRVRQSLARHARSRGELLEVLRRHRRPPPLRARVEEPRPQAPVQEDSDTLRAAFHMIENFGARAAAVAERRARNATADEVSKRWLHVARAIRRLRPDPG